MSIRKRISKRTDTVWWLVDYKDLNGVRRNKQFDKKSEATSFETKMRGEIVQGTHVPDSASITVGEAADIWLARCEANGLEESTTRMYKVHIERHIKPRLGKLKLSKLTAPVGQDFVDKLMADNNRPTVAKVVRSLKTLVSESVRRGQTTVNAIREVKLPSSSRDEEPPEFLTLVEVKALLAKAEGDFRNYVHAAIFSGMRPSELRGLAWEAVDLKTGVIHVRQRADRLNKLGKPKSKAGRRDIPIGPQLVAMLREWKLKQPTAQRVNGLVFPDPQGGVEDHTAFYRKLGALQIACGIFVPRLDQDAKPVLDKDGKPEVRQKYGLHALRHACASMLIAQGWQAKRLQTFLGHASITMTFDVYGHLWSDAEADQKAVAAAETALLG